MSDSISLVIRSADQTRKAAVTLPAALTVDQLLQTTQQKWNLPGTTNYAIRLERTGQQLVLRPPFKVWEFRKMMYWNFIQF